MKKILAAAGLAAALLASGPAFAADFSADQMKKMSVFLSNFTELGFVDFERADILDEQHPGDMVRFGIWHNYMNNFKARVAPCKVKGCQWGGLTMKGEFVRESLKRYFNYDLEKLPTVEDSDPTYHLENGVYHFEGADGELTRYARVKKAVKQADGTIVMTGELYNAEDESEKLGTFRAVALPHTWKGKPTWFIVSLRSKIEE